MAAASSETQDGHPLDEEIQQKQKVAREASVEEGEQAEREEQD